MFKQYPLIVANKYDETLIDKPIHCPKCKSEKIKKRSCRSTMVANMGNGPDPNHVWNECQCRECDTVFSYETKSGNAWYVVDNEILEGLSNCFEHYILKCAYCGGHVKRHYTNPDGSDTSGLITYSGGKQEQIEWFECLDCGKKESLDTIENNVV
jgi:hypothetical protein